MQNKTRKDYLCRMAFITHPLCCVSSPNISNFVQVSGILSSETVSNGTALFVIMTTMMMIMISMTMMMTMFEVKIIGIMFS